MKLLSLYINLIWKKEALDHFNKNSGKMMDELELKEERNMLDVIMLVTLAVCCGLVALLVHWCKKQVESDE